MKPPNHGCRVRIADLDEYPYEGYLLYTPEARCEGTQGISFVDQSSDLPCAIWTTDRITLVDKAYNGSSPLDTEGSR